MYEYTETSDLNVCGNYAKFWPVNTLRDIELSDSIHRPGY
jgi:hypothetical protein